MSDDLVLKSFESGYSLGFKDGVKEAKADLDAIFSDGYNCAHVDMVKLLEPILKQFKDDLQNCYASGEKYVRIDSMYLERLLDILE